MTQLPHALGQGFAMATEFRAIKTPALMVQMPMRRMLTSCFRMVKLVWFNFQLQEPNTEIWAKFGNGCNFTTNAIFAR
jgi:hypothetical protein